MSKEEGLVVLREEAILEKFDGEGDGAALRERITIVDGNIVNHEYFDEEGNSVGAGGDYNRTN